MGLSPRVCLPRGVCLPLGPTSHPLCALHIVAHLPPPSDSALPPPYGAPDRVLCITPQPRLRLLICIAVPPPLSVPSPAVATVTSRPSSTPTFADPPSVVATVQSDQRPLHRCPRRPRLRVAAGSITTPPPPTPAASPAAYLSLFPIAP
jgi:hypothetical protein